MLKTPLLQFLPDSNSAPSTSISHDHPFHKESSHEQEEETRPENCSKGNISTVKKMSGKDGNHIKVNKDELGLSCAKPTI